MNILYIGDIMGKPGIKTVSEILPSIKAERSIDLVIAQAENVTDGKGMSPDDMTSLKNMGIDFFTGGNHTPHLSELYPQLEDKSSPVIGPANMDDCPGDGWKYVEVSGKKVLVISLMGSKVGTPVSAKNPLHTIDEILNVNREVERAATVVNFHGDFSSEKRIVGYYLDGRVTAVIGDHWHVPTADAMILPGGTAHITDVGMCGSLHSSLGVTFDSVIPRWRDNIQTKNELETAGTMQFNGLLITVDESTGRAASVEHIQKYIS